jgi:hypothetical protein
MAKRDHGARVRRGRAVAAQARQRGFAGEVTVDTERSGPARSVICGTVVHDAPFASFDEERWICASPRISVYERAIQLAEDNEIEGARNDIRRHDSSGNRG